MSELANNEATETVEAQPEAETVETVENEQPEATEETKAEEMFKVKFNHEEKEITLDEAREYAQKGMNYDKINEKLQALESSPSLKFVEKQAKKYNMTTEEYLDAVAKEETAAEIAAIAVEKNVSEDVANELYEATKLKEKSIADAKKASEKAKQDEYMAEFVKQFPDVKEISQDVWDRFNKGDVSLVDAYSNVNMKNELASLKEQLAKYQEKESINNKNTNNAGASTGSVTGNGNASEAFYTAEQVRGMSKAEVSKNFELIEKSMKKW